MLTTGLLSANHFEGGEDLDKKSHIRQALLPGLFHGQRGRCYGELISVRARVSKLYKDESKGRPRTYSWQGGVVHISRSIYLIDCLPLKVTQAGFRWEHLSREQNHVYSND